MPNKKKITSINDANIRDKMSEIHKQYAHIMLTRINIKQELQKCGEKGNNIVLKDISQLLCP